MTDITHLHRDTLPSTAELLKATGFALVTASAILVTAVLPAEYGIDPTGIGERLGLTALSSESAKANPMAKDSSIEPSEALSPLISVLDAVWKAPAPYRSDEMSLTLQPDEGAEIKARMKTGDRFVFSWVAEGGEVNFDMHGERLNASSDEYTSYWKGRNKADSHGTFEAPFEGTHGWYWRNRGDKPVTITVKTSGFYETLYRP